MNKVLTDLVVLTILAHHAKGREPFFLMTASVPQSATGGSIIQMEPDTYNNFAKSFSSQLYNPIAVDYDPVDDKIYWSEVGVHRRIRRSKFGGSGMETVFTRNGSVIDGMAIDSVQRLLFYTDTGNNVIGKLFIPSFFHLSIIISGLDEPRAIVLDTRRSVMYWTDWGKNPKIERANYDGTGRQTLVSSGIRFVNALALDVDASRLYWVDAGTDLVETSDTNGNAQSLILKAASTHHFFGLALYRRSLYITDWESAGSSTSTSRLYRLDLDGSQQARSIAKLSFGRLNDIHAYDSSDPIKAINQLIQSKQSINSSNQLIQSICLRSKQSDQLIQSICLSSNQSNQSTHPIKAINQLIQSTHPIDLFEIQAIRSTHSIDLFELQSIYSSNRSV